MKLRRRVWIRVAVGLACLVLAAFAASFIQNALAQLRPENALPTMDVYYDVDKGDRLPVDHVRRDRFTWQFMFWVRSGGGLDLELWREIVPGYVQAGSNLELRFSIPAREVRVSRKDGEGEFVELAGQLTAPAESGEYTYKVEASWGTFKTVTYYFRIQVPWSL